jgi:hypothetical protein
VKARSGIRASGRRPGVGRQGTPQPSRDRLRFGGALIRRGGLLEVIGGAIRIQAILHGAREE